jgi:hypothetical protein
MIEIVIIEENLDKINGVYSFIGLLEAHYSMSKDKFLFDIRNAKEHLKKAITFFAIDIDDKLFNSKNNNDLTPQIIDNIKQSLKYLDAFLNEKKFKNIESLESELKEFIAFLEESYCDQNLDLAAASKHDLKTLKGKILFLVN